MLGGSLFLPVLSPRLEVLVIDNCVDCLVEIVGKALASCEGVCSDFRVSVVVCLFLFWRVLICYRVIWLAALVGVRGGGDMVVVSTNGNQANFEAFVFVSKRSYARLTTWLAIRI